MNEIKIRVPWGMVEERRAGAYVYMRFLGPFRRAMIPLSVIIPFLVGATFLHNLTSLNMLRGEVIAAILLFYLAIASWMITVARFARQADAEVAKAPCRKQDAEWTLSAEGVKGEGPVKPWSDVVEVLHVRGQTLLVLSIRLFVILPDAALPDGLTQEALRKQIDEWRK